jgi:tagatose 6-phosphate kinase
MILCVCLNPAVDVTYRIDRLATGHSHRVGQVTARAGGKAVNVARGLQALQAPVELMLPLGGPAGDQMRHDLQQAGIVVHELAGGPTRRTVTVVDAAGAATAFNEAGPPLAPADCAAWTAALRHHARGTAVVVLSGSVPPGLSPSGYGELVRLARAEGAQVIVDCSGQHLLAALGWGPAIVKPNAPELAEVTGGLEGVAAARALQVRSPRTAVVASRGADGLLVVADGEAWQARLPRAVVGNPTGAGDAVVASLAADLWRASAAGTLIGWPVALRRAVALSASAVLQPVAGAVDVALAAQLAEQVQIEPVSLE